MTLEANLWAWLKNARTQLNAGPHGEQLQMERIENSLGAGIPDVEGFVCIRDSTLVTSKLRAQFWLELKSHERPARSSTPIRFPLAKREAQIEFLRKRWAMGGNAFWLCQIGSGTGERRLYLLAGDLGAKLKAGMTESEIAVECAAYGALDPKLTAAQVIQKVAECRSKLSLIRR